MKENVSSEILIPNKAKMSFQMERHWTCFRTRNFSDFGSQVVYRPVDIIGSEIPHCLSIDESITNVGLILTKLG